MTLGFSFPGSTEILLILLVLLIGTGFWIWMLVDCATNESLEGNEKIVWILIIIFTNWLGALLYFLICRPRTRDA